MKALEKIRRNWSKAPDRASREIPVYYGNTPRLDSIRTIARHCASSELKLYSKADIRKNGKENAEVIAEHELYDVFDNPVPTFPEIDGFTLKYFTFAMLDLVGECAWLKIREGRRIIALLPICKSWIIKKPTIAEHYYLIRPYGELSGQELFVPAEDVILFKDIDINDPYGNGKGLAESIADEIETDEYASKYQKNFFFNDATPPYVITGFQGNEQSAQQIKKSFMEKIGGFIHAREPAVLTGNMQVQTLGINPKELDMVESRKFLRDECLQHFQLPPEVMGIIENSNRATIDSSFYLMQKNVIKPRLEMFERVLNRQLLRDYDADLCCMHDFEIEEDMQLKLQVYQTGLLNGVVTREEFRSAFGFIPEIKEGTLIMPISSQVVEAGEEINIEEIELPEEENPDEIPEETPAENPDENNEDENGKNIALEMIKKKDERQQWKMNCWKMFDSKATSKEPLFIVAVKKIAKKQLSDLKNILKNYDGTPIENLIAGYFTKEVDSKVKSTLANAWIESMKAGRENANSILGKKALQTIDDVSITNDKFNKWVEKYGLEKSVLMNETTKKELVKKLKEILADDISELSADELAKRLMKGAEEIFEELSNTRAYMIARTETGSSVNIGQLATYEANGVKKKEWFATLDNRTRETHLAMNGTVININESFEVVNEFGGIDNLQYPLDPNGTAGNVINCRCVVVPVID